MFTTRTRPEPLTTVLPWKQALGKSRRSAAASAGRALFQGHGFAGQGGLADEEVLGLQHAGVGRDDVAGGQDDDVAGNDVPHGDLPLPAVAQDVDRRLDQLLQLLGRFVRTALLEIGQEDAEEDHSAHDQRGLEIAHEEGDRGDDQKLDDQRIFEALEEVGQNGVSFPTGQGVGTGRLEAGGGFVPGQAFAAAGGQPVRFVLGRAADFPQSSFGGFVAAGDVGGDPSPGLFRLYGFD